MVVDSLHYFLLPLVGFCFLYLVLWSLVSATDRGPLVPSDSPPSGAVSLEEGTERSTELSQALSFVGLNTTISLFFANNNGYSAEYP
jgi:hypothetical protein